MLKDTLSGLDREQLQFLLLKLAEQEPTLTQVIEELVRASRPLSPETETTASRGRAHGDTKAVRREVRSLLQSLDQMRSSRSYWSVGEVIDGLSQILEQGWTFIEDDDGVNALSLLDAITNAYVSEWMDLDDSSGEASDFFADLGQAWTEALLSLDLSSQQREIWASKLEAWQHELDDYGIDEVFDAAYEAALHGWDDPQLQDLLKGTSTNDDAWDAEVPALTVARLHILERCGRLQEYLRLARVQSQKEAYVTMLVRLDRTQEADEYGQDHLSTAQETFTLAKALYDHGEHELGLQAAERGLRLQGSKATLAKWLRDQAVIMGKTAQALGAAEVAFHEEIRLVNYLRMAEIAGEQWSEQRTRLLEDARHTTSYFPEGQVDVFLHEGLIDDAIAAVETGATHTLVERVVDAALPSHPEWVIKTSRRQAEPFMNDGKAQYYRVAASWLALARTAYRNMGREEEWQAYLSELLGRHRRKYKLVPMLEALR